METQVFLVSKILDSKDWFFLFYFYPFIFMAFAEIQSLPLGSVTIHNRQMSRKFRNILLCTAHTNYFHLRSPLHRHILSLDGASVTSPIENPKMRPHLSSFFCHLKPDDSNWSESPIISKLVWSSHPSHWEQLERSCQSNVRGGAKGKHMLCTEASDWSVYSLNNFP